jgi:hypothetical protein
MMEGLMEMSEAEVKTSSGACATLRMPSNRRPVDDQSNSTGSYGPFSLTPSSSVSSSSSGSTLVRAGFQGLGVLPATSLPNALSLSKEIPAESSSKEVREWRERHFQRRRNQVLVRRSDIVSSYFQEELTRELVSAAKPSKRKGRAANFKATRLLQVSAPVMVKSTKLVGTQGSTDGDC